VKKDMETRSFDMQLTSDDQPVLHGYALRWNELSSPLPFLEKFLPGAFQEQLRSGDDVLALVDHDTGKVIGRRSNNTLDLIEDEQGLRIEIKPNTGTTWGKDIVSLVERRDVTGMSIGFKAEQDTWDNQDGKQIRSVEKASLVEVSVVVNPAYAGTNIDKRNGVENIMTDEVKTEVTQTEAKSEERAEVTSKKVLAAEARNPEREKIEHRQLFNEYLRTGNLETRQQMLSTPAAGGVTATEDFRSELIKALGPLSVMRQIARVLPPITGSQGRFPRVNTLDAATMVDEAGEIGPQEAAFNQVVLTPSKCAVLTFVSNELLKDTAIDFAGYLAEYFAESIAAVIEDQYLNGNGAAPNLTGVLDGATLTRVECAANNAVVLGDILNLHNGLPARYRNNAAWLMHPDLEATLSQMVDATGRPIIISDWSSGLRRTLLGKPIYLSDSFPNTVGAGLDIMAFGDFKRGIYIGDSAAMDVQRNDSVGFANDLVAFRATFRTDIAVALPDAVRVLALDS
jgi:uncharacterized protein